MSTGKLPGVNETPTPSEEVLESGLPYVSKSRIKTYLQCPRKFFWKYVCETRPPGSIYTERGSQVHETFEEFHLNLLDYLDEHGEFPERFTPLLPEWGSWAQWIEMVGEFFRFELRRKDLAHHHVAKADAMMAGLRQDGLSDFDAEWRNLWQPVGVEVEFWLGDPPEEWDHDGNDTYIERDEAQPVGEIPWMGYADLIVRSQTVPEVEGNGVTIIDYKTGTAPTVKYEGKPWLEENLQEGVWLEGEYYGWMAEKIDSFDYEIDAVAGYYPENDELIVTPYPNQDRRRDIKRAVLGMQHDPDIENFETDESPLCHYNNAKNHGQCFFYPVCPVQRDCADCDSTPTSGSGRYD